LRLDVYLVQQKLANSRTQAQDFIQNGFVSNVQNEMKLVLNKSNYIVKETDKIVVDSNQLQKFVSRAGLKLEAALKHLNLTVQDKVVLDVGQSTGGFTDCLLQRGAKQVVGIDVGHGQLHESLKNHPKVISFENLNAKDLSVNTSFLRSVPVNQFDLIVADVSFISLGKIIPSIANFIPADGEYLLLVKPQFECGRENLDENGLVKDIKIYKAVEADISAKALEHFKNVQEYFPSEVLGKDGNQEFFIYGKKSI
jgi:23S rRNA (cytidine1920-2'-O)/16S rRNA (cytidine1409-2'-O)-methyltransferase